MKRCASVIFFIATLTSHCLPQWSNDPTQNLIVGYGLNPELCSDSAGGCYITYEQNLVYPRHLILERLNRYGYNSWGGSKQLLGLLPEQWSATITGDNHHGVIVSYLDDDWQDSVRLRVQRIDSNGNFLWGANGVRVTLSEMWPGDQAIMSDGRGGCIVVWRQEWQNLSGSIIGQRIDSLGSKVWGDTGVILAGDNQYPPKLIQIASDKFVIAYGASLTEIDIQGDVLLGGQAIDVGFGTNSVISDGQGGVIVYDGTGTPSNVAYVAQRFDSLGNAQWTKPYVVVAESTIYSVFGYPINRVNGSGIIVAWQESLLTVSRLFIQKLTPIGSAEWPSSGIAISRNASDQILPQSIAGDNSHIIFTWRDSRGGNFAQEIDTNGLPKWDTADIAVCIPTLSYEKMTTDCNGGCIIAGCGDTFSICVQQVSKNGRLGEIITSVGDGGTRTLPEDFILYQNYPNPFNPSTTISYSLPKSEWISLRVYDILANEVASLYEGMQTMGKHTVIFDGSRFASGTYLLVLKSQRSPPQVRKLLLLR